MELKAYITPLIKYWWLLLLSAIIAATSSFMVTGMQPPSYQSKTTLVIGRAVYQANPNGNDLYLSQQLASFYVELAMKEPVRNATMSALGLDWLPEYNVQALPNSQFLEIDVIDSLPVRAQAVANELARQLISQTPEYSSTQNQEDQVFVKQQLDQLKAKITDTQALITQKQTELQDLNSAREISDAQQEISVLESKLNTLQNNFALLFSNSGQDATNTLTVIEPADLPTVPVAPNRPMIVLLSTALALGVSGGAAYLLEYIDDTIKTSEQVERLGSSQVIGSIAEVGKEEREAFYISRQSRSTLANAFRYLRTNLEFITAEKPLRTLLVTSTGGGEGKTFIATNLAIVMSQVGRKVILLDIDFRRPNIHERLDVSNQSGLSDVLMGTTNVEDVIQSWDHLQVITSGSLPLDPGDLLSSEKMEKVLEDLRQLADVIIIDSPPLFVSDAAIVASRVDGVLLIIRQGRTRKGEFLASLEKLNRVGARTLGVVINRSQHSSDDYYYKHSNYHQDEKSKEKK